MQDKSEVTIPDRSSPGTARTSSADFEKDGGGTYATGSLHKIRVERETESK